MSFKMEDMKFIDYYVCCGETLDRLAKNLYDKADTFKTFHVMKERFPEHMDLLCRQGFYPYEQVDGIEQLDYDGIPPKEAFFAHS